MCLNEAGIASGQQMVLWTFAVSGALWRSEPFGGAIPLAELAQLALSSWLAIASYGAAQIAVSA